MISSHRDKRINRSAIFLFVLGTSLFSCKKESTDIGLGVQPGEDILNATAIDTFTIESYTELEDSIITSKLTNNLVGSYVDPVFGLTTSATYTQFALGSANLVVDPGFVVDSVKLQLHYSGYYGGFDAQTFTVQRITQRFSPDSTYFSNKVLAAGSDLMVSSAPITPDLSSTVIVGADTLNPLLLLNLQTSLGTDLLNAAIGGSFASQSTFDDFFYGLRIGVNNVAQPVGTGGILYFDMLDAQTKLVVYYTEPSGQKQVSFQVGTTQARFSSFTHDYTGTPVGNALATPSLGQKSFYAQTMAGVEGVLKINGIDNLKDIGNIIINKAELHLPIQYFTGEKYPPTGRGFVFYKTTDGEASPADLDPSNILAYGGVYEDSQKEYVFNIGRHVQRLVKGEIENLGFVVNTGFSSVAGGRIIFNGQQTTNREKPYIKIYYTKY